MSFRIERIWVRRAGLVAAEHALFALSGLLLNVFLARWLTGQEYGTYALAYSLLLLIVTLHKSLLTEPLLVFGAGRYSADFGRYLATLRRGHWMATGVVAAALATAGAALAAFGGGSPLAPVCWGLAAATPCVTLLWLLRRACYARLEPLPSVLGGGLYFVLLMGGAAALYLTQSLTVFSTLALLGAASLLAGLWLGARLRERVGPGGGGGVAWREVLATHYAYGRWATGANLLWWVPLNSLVVLLPLWRDLEDGATLRAVVNLILPALQVNAAFGAVILPALVAQTADPRRFARTTGLCLLLFGGAALCYYAVLAAAGERLLRAVYGGRYDHSARALWVIGLAPLLDGAAVVLSGALRALNEPKRIFAAYLCSAATAVAAGYAGARWWGVGGAAAAMVLAFAVACVLLAVPLILRLRAGGLAAGPDVAGGHVSAPAGQAVFE